MWKNECRWLASVMMNGALLCGCATNSLQPPVIGRQVTLTPLAASVTGIDLKNSAAWQEKASKWLQKVGQFSESETAR